MTTAERNYKQAKRIFDDVSEDFYQIENNPDSSDDTYLIDQTLDDVKRLHRHLNRIHIEELEKDYDQKTIDVVEKNINHMREGSYYIERSLMSMKLFDKLHPVLDKYIKDVEWNKIADTEEEAVTKFGRFLTSEDNYELYKTIINNMVKGTMKKKQFQDLFHSISSRIAKPRTKKAKQRHPLPPEMYPEKERKALQKQMDDRRKNAVEDEKAEFDQFEGFIGLDKYEKLNS